MSVLFQVNTAQFVVDFFVDTAPLNSKNLIKLCRLKYFNGCLVYNVQKGYVMMMGDRTGSGMGGCSAVGYLGKSEGSLVGDEITLKRKLDRKGLVCLVNKGRQDSNNSVFFITLRDEDLDHLAESGHTIVGEVVEGLDKLIDICDNIFVDEKFRPLQDLRILHTFVLDDPFPDPQFDDIVKSPLNEEIPSEEKVEPRIPYSTEIRDKIEEGLSWEEREKLKRKAEAKSRAQVLEMVGDLPDAEIKPDDNILFVCKLNPITTDEDLELLFARFGTVKSCNIIKDRETGESLQYAFIEFEKKEACEEAYIKMNSVMIDDRRIKVDFSQSVGNMWNKWTQTSRHKRPRN